ncbi:MAG: energy-coupling factor transporter transmembrane protein EcfT [Lachnospiraceae bacterium]|nr:energy-coupling factor transporter transmembrane protein EcfT [Lachnospiraceae bacterium]
MIRDITLGQYYPGDSVMHRLDPRTKLLGTLVYLISLFLFTNSYVFVVAALFLGTCIVLSKVPLRHMLKGLKPVIFLLLFTAAMNLFFTKGTVLVSFWKIQITREGLLQAISMGTRLILLILGSNLMTLTTTPTRLTAGMEHLMKPLKLFFVPVHEIAMMMSIALRFIPILLEETDRIMKAQLARGADFESGNLLRRAKSMVPVLVPLFVSAFRRANDLAMAMEARCYHGGKGRTQYRPLRYKGRDLAAYVLLLLYFAAVIVSGKWLPGIADPWVKEMLETAKGLSVSMSETY